MCVCVCMHVYMYVCMHACMHVCMYACMHVCMHVCAYTRAYTQVYRHIHKHARTHALGGMRTRARATMLHRCCGASWRFKRSSKREQEPFSPRSSPCSETKLQAPSKTPSNRREGIYRRRRAPPRRQDHRRRSLRRPAAAASGLCRRHAAFECRFFRASSQMILKQVSLALARARSRSLYQRCRQQACPAPLSDTSVSHPSDMQDLSYISVGDATCAAPRLGTEL